MVDRKALQILGGGNNNSLTGTVLLDRMLRRADKATSKIDSRQCLGKRKYNMLMKGRWKLRLSRHTRTDIQAGEPLTPELFDLDVDPFERYNVADRYPELVTMLTEKLYGFARELNAKVDE